MINHLLFSAELFSDTSPNLFLVRIFASYARLGPSADRSNFEPPSLETDYYEGVWDNQMRRFCVNRHEGAINCLYMDFSVRRTNLKCLWNLKWHRLYNNSLDAPKPDWDSEAPWMEKFKNCEH